jgi:hypothetical protein
MKKLLILSLPFMLVACSSDDEKKPEPAPQAPLTQSQNSEAFNKGFDKLLTSYYSLQAAFVKEDTMAIATNAKALKLAADSLPVNLIKADSSIIDVAKTDAQNISDEIKGLLGEKDLENKRKSFETTTNHLAELIKVVKYDKSVVYLIHCPMAFNNKGADWLSKTDEVVNPYLPKDMPNCGEVKDSIDYRIK